MQYQTALNILEKAVAKLQEDDGNMSNAQLELHTFAVKVASDIIIKHNGLVQKP